MAGRRGPRVVAAVTVLAAGLAGCASAGPPAEHPPAPRLVASATQFRPDEGTPNLHAGVTNLGTRPVTVTSATVVWPGFSWRTVRIPAVPVPAGQTAAFVVRYGAAHCDTHPGAPYLLTEVDGRRLRLPLKVDLPGLLPRLLEHACAEQRLARTALVDLRLGRHSVTGPSGEYLPGVVVLRRRPGAATPVTLVDLGGSVLFDVLPARHGALPARLRSAEPRLTVPVRVGSAGRCDPHARGNSSQTFLFSTYTRLGDDPVVRTIFVPPRATQALLLRLLDRACRAVEPAA